jgi:anti-sigma B factor antagonist
VLLEVTVEKANAAADAWLISLDGELDHDSAPRFAWALDSATPPAGQGIVLDLSRLGFLDSSGLAAILELYRRMDRAGAGFAIVSSRPQITRIFAVTAIDQVVSVRQTQQRAFAALAGSTPQHNGRRGAQAGAREAT